MKKSYIAVVALLLPTSEYVLRIIGGPYDSVALAQTAIVDARNTRPTESYYVIEVLQ